MREIIEGARFGRHARTKAYLIDEVHMLSKQAFNGLLKTLEEPPDHVKFLFATTEIEKVPVTVRSRCQRFDLRRIDAGVLIAFLAGICAKEGVAIEAAALALIARAAEGSARDALSLLDQAIAHGAGHGSGEAEERGGISAEALRAMLGLADHGRIIDLFEAVMRGEMARALGGLKDLYDGGADPAAVLVALAEFVHLVTRLKLAPEAVEDAAITPEERARGAGFAARLSMPVLTRAWQLLSKGLQEVKDSDRPLAAADMVLVRLAYAADLPTPDEALRKLAALTDNFSTPGPASGARIGETAGALSPAAAPASAARPAPRRDEAGEGVSPRAALFPVHRARRRRSRRSAAIRRPSTRLSTFEDVVALAGLHRDIQLKLALERDVRLVRFEDGAIEFSPAPGASAQLAQVLMRRLQEWTGRRWIVAVASEAGAPSLKEAADEKARQAMNGVRADPLVRRALEVFPGAEIVAVRVVEEAAAARIAAARRRSRRRRCGIHRRQPGRGRSVVRTPEQPSASAHEKGSMMRDMLGLMKQAQAMQEKIQAMQAEMERLEVEGQSGGGMVRVTLSAKGQLRNVTIDDQLLKQEEKQILEDLIVTAHEDARKKAERLMEEKMQGMTAGLALPPGMKLPF